MEKDDAISIAVSLGFSIIGMVLEYLRNAGVAEEIINANWELVKQKHSSRPSDKLPEIPEPVEEEPQ